MTFELLIAECDMDLNLLKDVTQLRMTSLLLNALFISVEEQDTDSLSCKYYLYVP